MTATPRDEDHSALPVIRLAGTERERVVSRLSDAFAQDVIVVEEFERRVEAVYRAATRADLDLLVRDLPSPTPASTQRSAASSLAPSTDSDRRIAAVFSSVERTGFHEMPRHLDIRVLLGNVELDLSGSCFAPGITEISVSATFGNVEMLLPAGVIVENDGQALIGSFEYRVSKRKPRPSVGVPAATAGLAAGGGVAVVRITGRARLSSVSIRQLREHE